MIKKNKRFYGGGSLNFLTFANDNYLSRANAIEYAGRFKDHDDITVWEFGVGTGEFALNFLDYLKTKVPDVYNKTNYVMFDFSKTFLSKASALLKKRGHKNIETVYYEGPNEIPKQGANYVRMNEFWDDIEADVYTDRKGKLYNLEKKRFEDNPAGSEFLKHLPPDSEVVINTGAAKHLWELKRKLARSCYIDVFDYGFIEFEPPYDTKLGYVRRESEHITYDINYIYMKAFAKSLGMETYVESQDSYVDSIIPGLRAVDIKDRLCYMNDKELKQNKSALIRAGYTEGFMCGEIKEQNDFYHMRIW